MRQPSVPRSAEAVNFLATLPRALPPWLFQLTAAPFLNDFTVASSFKTLASSRREPIWELLVLRDAAAEGAGLCDEPGGTDAWTDRQGVSKIVGSNVWT